jgi:nucleotide-binding universal stress UspA family protein
MEAKTLVVPLDGSEYSERALPIAEALAMKTGGGLVLVSVPFHGPVDPRGYLEEQATRITQCPVELFTSDDFVAPGAIQHALEAGEDRIACMTTHGRGSWRWAAVGSVAEEVIRSTTRPLLLVGRNCRADFLKRGPNLLVCVDSTVAAATLAPAVHTWAQTLSLRVHLAIVVHPLDVPSAEQPEQLLGPLVEALGPTDVDGAELLRATYVAGALVDYADDLTAALIAMSPHARTGASRFMLGSKTMAILHQASCPALVVRSPSTADRPAP